MDSRNIKVIFIGDAKSSYEKLQLEANEYPNSFHADLLKSINKNLENIRKDAAYCKK